MMKLFKPLALCLLLITMSANAVLLTLEITFDNFPEETAFGLFDSETTSLDNILGNPFIGIAYDVDLSSPIGIGDGYALAGDFTGESGTAQFIWDIAPGNYTFYITDDFGDGICCDFGEGGYSLSVGGNVIASGGEFLDLETVEFTVVPVPGALVLFGSLIAGWVGFGRRKTA